MCGKRTGCERPSDSYRSSTAYTIPGLDLNSPARRQKNGLHGAVVSSFCDLYLTFVADRHPPITVT